MNDGDPRQLLEQAHRSLEELRSALDSSIEEACRVSAPDIAERLEPMQATIEHSAELLAELRGMLLGGL